MSSSSMNALERRAVLALACIYLLRMLGLFMVLPVFALYAPDYAGYSATLAGLAIGAYGLTQALLQVPLGLASDRFGRKPVILFGLVLFVLGSVVAALADSLPELIAGRALQGAGAVAAAIMALTADLTRDEQRTRAMAGIGASIGIAFGAGMVLGPAMAALGGLSGVFWLTAALATAGIAVLHFAVPTPQLSRHHGDALPVVAQFGHVLRDRELVRLDVGIFLLHLALTAAFVALPLHLRDAGGVPAGSHWLVYLGLMVASLLLMVPFIIASERGGRLKSVFLGGIALLAASLTALGALQPGLLGLLGLLVLFFAAVNVLEAMLPAIVSRSAPAQMKGTALGVYSTAQFSGAFAGGVLGGWLHASAGVATVFLGAAAVVGLWLVVAAGMRPPALVSRRLLSVGELDDAEARVLSERLGRVAGVREAVVVAADGVAYLKVERSGLDEDALRSAVSR